MHLYLFLCSHSLLVSLPPGRVMDVAKGFIPCFYPTGPEELANRKLQIDYIIHSIYRDVAVAVLLIYMQTYS